MSLPLYLTPLLLTTGAYKALPVSPQTLAVSGELIREVVLHMQARSRAITCLGGL